MIRKLSILTSLAVILATSFLAACTTTSSPNALTGKERPIYNDKNRIVGYTQAR